MLLSSRPCTSVSNRVPFTRQLHDASHVEVEAVELVVCVKIRSGTEAVSMSATEGLSVDATVGCVYIDI